MAPCPLCRGGQLELVEQRGELQTLRCDSCGHEESSLVYSGDAIPKIETREVEIRARWTGGHPTSSEIAVLRRLFPQFRDRNVAALQRDLGAAESVFLGRRTLEEARGLAHAARLAGLIVEIVDGSPDG